jgi:hypothetical protein
MRMLKRLAERDIRRAAATGEETELVEEALRRRTAGHTDRRAAAW